MPNLVAEDLQVKDFPDPGEDDQPATSNLLGTLKLPGRRGLPLTAIERALLEHSARVVEKEIGLDPRALSASCAPRPLFICGLVRRRAGDARPSGPISNGYIVMADGRSPAVTRGSAGGTI